MAKKITEQTAEDIKSTEEQIAEGTKPAEKQTVEETNSVAAPETVTVPLEEFKAMQAQLALLTQQITSEERMKAIKGEAALEDEKLLEQVRAANEKAKEEIEYYIDEGSIKSNKNVNVSINGVQYIIPKGQTVKIPRGVSEIIDNSKRQRAAAFGLQDKRKAAFEAAEAKGYFSV